MKVEICIEAGAQVKQDLLSRLADLLPEQRIAGTVPRLHNDCFALKFFLKPKHLIDCCRELEMWHMSLVLYIASIVKKINR